MDTIMLIGRILLSLIFLASGIGHLTKADAMTGYAQFKKVPSPKASVLLSGALMLLGAAGVILGVWADLAALVLAILSIVIALMMHKFWAETDPQAKAAEQAGFFKNLGLAGGMLAVYAVAATDQFGWALGSTILS
ncbi:MAG: DoxX family protein [Acidimicrobiia bacterium]